MTDRRHNLYMKFVAVNCFFEGLFTTAPQQSYAAVE